MSQVETYIAANTEYEAAKKDLAVVAETLREVGGQLQSNPERFHFANAGGDGLPMDIVLNRSSKSMDAAQWPTPAQVNALIFRRFNARRAVEQAWGSLPRATQASLVAPKI